MQKLCDDFKTTHYESEIYLFLVLSVNGNRGFQAWKGQNITSLYYLSILEQEMNKIFMFLFLIKLEQAGAHVSSCI
jgi:hypothetical protein